MRLKSLVTFDVECYKNYFLIQFRRVHDGKIIYYEMFNDSELNTPAMVALMQKYTLVSFNGNNYDTVIVDGAIAGCCNQELKNISDEIIQRRAMPWDIRKKYNLPRTQFDHIDLIEVAPLTASLKIYGGRLHSELMQDLPIHPSATIKKSETPLMRKYCGNDLILTQDLLFGLKKELRLREVMGKQYGVDLRSKSDAQVAEAVIKSLMKSKYNFYPEKPEIKTKEIIKYKLPDNIKFRSRQMKKVLATVLNADFGVKPNGHIDLPPELKNMTFKLGLTTYKIGAGGLHSQEKKTRWTNENDMILREYDVASYYPWIILINKLYPKHLGPVFLKVYREIVEARLKGKREGDVTVADSLKIVINATFGKLASVWSYLYSPDLMLQVTLTGQLSLLMLIEDLLIDGISVVSANTDGIIVNCPRQVSNIAGKIVNDWEGVTGYTMDATEYASLNARDVNNYVAIKADEWLEDDKRIKGKGAYKVKKLDSNPQNTICGEAVRMYLAHGTPIEDTIKGSTDIRKFLTVRKVNGGAVKNGVKLGKAIRWYQGAHELDGIYYASNGNLVATSSGGVPIMNLPNKFPSDVDIPLYIEEANKMLKVVGF